MSKNRLLLGMLLLALGAAAFLTWRSLSGAADLAGGRRPESGERNRVDAVAAHGDTGAAATASNGAIADQDVDRAIEQPRTAVAGTPDGGEQHCRLEVHCVVAAGEQSAPASFTEIEIRDERGPLLRSTTDAGGRLVATLPCAADTPVVMVCALGASTAATLRPASTLEVEMTVPVAFDVRGLVVDSRGQPVPSADLLLLAWPDQERPIEELWRVGRAGPDGRFHLRLAAAGRLGATHPSFAASPMQLLRAGRERLGSPRVASVHLQFTLPDSASGLRGLVLAADGSPVAGANIELRSALPPPPGAELRAPPLRGRSRGDGTFTFDSCPSGGLLWSADAPGHGWAHGALSADHLDRPVVLRLSAACIVEGTVTRSDGSPVASATVVARAAGNRLLRRTTTKADGSFRCTDLGAGRVELHASGPATEHSAVAETELVLEPVGSHRWHAVLPPFASGPVLRGTALDQDEQPLSGWRIFVRQPDREMRTGLVDAAGEFAIAVDRAEGLDVRIYPIGRPPTEFAAALLRNVNADQTLDIRVEERSMARIRGLAVDFGHRPLAVTIDCRHHERDELARFQAGDDGRLVCDGVPPGTLDVTLRFPRMLPTTLRGLAVEEATTLDLGTVVLEQAGALFGDLQGPDGSPPADCEVALIAGEQRLLATYSAGRYRFDPAPPGDHVLQIQGPDIAAATFPVRVEGGVDLQQDVVLHRGLPRRIVVTVPAGSGQRAHLALLREGERPRWVASRSVEPSAVEEIEFVAYLAAGSYRAIAWTDGGAEAQAAVSFAVPEEPPLRMLVAPRPR